MGPTQGPPWRVGERGLEFLGKGRGFLGKVANVNGGGVVYCE